jgi:PKD repeat protein
MNLKKIIVLGLLILTQSTELFAQNFEWLKSFGSKKDSDYLYNIGSDDKVGVVFLNGFNSGIADTIQYDTFKVIKPKHDPFYCYVSADSQGKVRNVLPMVSNNRQSTYMARDSSGNVYITTTFSGILKFDSAVYNSKKGNILFLKYDRNLKLKWATQAGSDTLSFPMKLEYSYGHLYFNCIGRDTARFGTKTYILYFGNLIGEIHPTTGKIMWSSLVTTDIGPNITGIVNMQGNVVISGFGDQYQYFRIWKDTAFGGGGFIAMADSVGNFKKLFNFHNDKTILLQSMATDGEYIYFGGSFQDTMLWGGKKIKPGSTLKSGLQPFEMYAACVDKNLNPQWFFRPEILEGGTRNIVMDVTTSRGFAYFGAILGAKKIRIDSLEIVNSSNRDAMIFKADFLGNILWATHGGVTSSSNINLTSITATEGKAIFAGGNYSGKIRFGKLSDSTKYGNDDIWITRISDYSINRGNVSKGPYCAGDSIKIPYTIFGKFDTSNIFYAQLSDENGEFNKGYKELGRLKSNKNGVIKGVLPNFKVYSSPKYRIRIYSTNPPVQSYYRRDTLRLLIYSTDKANPGPPETICVGDTVKLETFGGTKWQWSPNYRIQDPVARTTFAWPNKTTHYQIVIADSSGCGQADTAVKIIYVKPPLKAALKYADTSLCSNYTLKIPVAFSGGDTGNYAWQWYFVLGPKNWFKGASGSHGSADTLTYTPSVDLTTNEKLAVVLTDACTHKADTAYLIIRLRKQAIINNKIKDTSICFGNTIKWKALSSGSGIWRWKDLTNNMVLSNTDSLAIKPTKTIKIQVTLSNGCNTDTNTFSISVTPPLSTSILTASNDSVLCYNQSIALRALAKGGKGSGYRFGWYLDAVLHSSADTFLLNPKTYFSNAASSHRLVLVLGDNCSASDSVVRVMRILEAPVADFSVGNVCNGSTVGFTFTGSKASAPFSTSYAWDFAALATSNLQNPQYRFTSSGLLPISLLVSSSNGCSDFISKNIPIKQQATAAFSVDDICQGDTAKFINQSLNAQSYRWKLGDGNTSVLFNPQHRYAISGTTTTFNVSLVAIIASGCSDSITKAITVNAAPKPGFSYTTSAQSVSFTANEPSAAEYLWDFGDGSSAKVFTPKTAYTYSKFPSGTYSACLRVTNSASCVAQACSTIFISGAVGVLNPSLGFKVYPNPNKGSFVVEVDEFKLGSKLLVTNMLGQLLFETPISASITTVDTILPNGTYLVTIQSGNTIVNQRIVVCK